MFTSIWITAQKPFTLLTASNFHISLRHNFCLQTTIQFKISKNFYSSVSKKTTEKKYSEMERRQKVVKKKTWLSVYANGKKKFILNFIFLYRKFYQISFFFFIFQALYSRIAISLWKSSKGLGRNLQMKSTSSSSAPSGMSCTKFTKQPSKYEKRALNASESEVKS